MTRITDSFVAHAHQHPHQRAITDGQHSLTYGELLRRVEHVAGAIAPLAAEPTPKIGILLPNCLELLELFLGTALAGGIALILNPDWPPTLLQTILDRHPPAILISETKQLQAIEDWGNIKAIALHTLLPPSPTPPQPNLKPTDAKRPDASPQVTPWPRGSGGRAAVSQSGGLGGDAPPSHTSANQPHFKNHNPVSGGYPSLPTNAFYIGFTSGTTGHPKAILRTHPSWLHSFAASQLEFNITPADTILVPGSLVHSLSLYTAIEALALGATLHILPSFSPKAVLQALNTVPITRLVAVPTLLKAIATTAQTTHFPRLKTVIVGGSKLSPELRQQLTKTFPHADILEYYGASELSFVSIASSRESVPPESVGRPFHGVTLSVQKDDGSGEATIGEIGWIGIQSAMICSGYLDPQPESGFRIQQGWATVGDRGYRDKHGYLYLVGRERDMLISGGINVYPSEIEAVLLQLPQIDQAVVLGLPDDCRGELICAVLTWRGAETLKRTTLIKHISDRLGRAKCPRRFFSVASLPITSSGKIARSQLQAHILQGHLSPHELRT